MAARRTATQIATLAALAVATFGGTAAHSAASSVPSAAPNVWVFVFGGSVFTMPFSNSFLFSGVSQMGGGG